MEVYRIAKTKRIADLSGSGAKLYGGRWNRKNTSLIYTSETRALATAEFLVHTDFLILPDDISIATIEIPDDTSQKEIKPKQLPKNWRDYPGLNELAIIGSNWVSLKETLILRVPSAVVLHEYNILINPLHPDIKFVKIKSIEKYYFDKRLLK